MPFLACNSYHAFMYKYSAQSELCSFFFLHQYILVMRVPWFAGNHINFSHFFLYFAAQRDVSSGSGEGCGEGSLTNFCPKLLLPG